VWWHTNLELPFCALVADRHKQRDKGYATEEDILLARGLQRNDVSKASMYGMKNLQVCK